MSSTRRNRGFALVTALLFVAVLSILTGLVALFTINNAKHTRSNIRINKTLAVAQGARNFGATLLGTTISAELDQEITAESQAGILGSSGSWVFDPSNSSKNSATPDPNTVLTNLASLGSNLQSQLQGSGCYGPYSLSSGESLMVQISFTGSLAACGSNPAASGLTIGAGRFLNGSMNGQQTYSLPYIMVATGTQAGATRRLTLTGQYNFTVGQGSFARYALFTDSEQVASGSQNFFTGAYLFNGPVHTNGNFAFYGNKFDPNVSGSGQPYFFGPVSSSGSTDAGRPGAWFLGSKHNWFSFRTPSQLSSTSYDGTHPRFQAGVSWTAQTIPLPTNSINQKSAAQSNGIYLNGDADSITMYAGDASGAKLVDTSGTWQPAAGATAPVYQYITVCDKNSSCTQYREDSNRVLYEYKNGSWQQNTSPFNGVIYVNGNVNAFTGPARDPLKPNDPSATPPAVASFAQLNLVSSEDVRITGDLKYQDPVCNGALRRDPTSGKPIQPTCTSDPSAITNVLGIYAAGDSGGYGSGTCQFPSGDSGAGTPGNVCIGHTTSLNANYSHMAPSNLEVDATVMAATKVDMEKYNSGTPMGTFSILGGVIAKYDGVYGVFDPSTGQLYHGVLPRFTYDPRFGNGLAPPLFPTVKLTSLVSAAEPIIYSQTEQTAY